MYKRQKPLLKKSLQGAKNIYNLDSDCSGI